MPITLGAGSSTAPVAPAVVVPREQQSTVETTSSPTMMNKRLDLDEELNEARRRMRVAEEQLASVRAELALERQRSGKLERALQSMMLTRSESAGTSGPPCRSEKIQSAAGGERISQAAQQRVPNDDDATIICDECKMRKKSSGDLTAPTSNKASASAGRSPHNAPFPLVEGAASNGPTTTNAGPHQLVHASKFAKDLCLERTSRSNADAPPKDDETIDAKKNSDDVMPPTSSDMDLTAPISNTANARIGSEMDLTVTVSNKTASQKASQPPTRNASFGNLPSVINVRTTNDDETTTANAFQRLLHGTAAPMALEPGCGIRDSLTLARPRSTAHEGPEEKESSVGGGDIVNDEKDDDENDHDDDDDENDHSENDNDNSSRQLSIAESISLACLNRSLQDGLSLKGGAGLNAYLTSSTDSNEIRLNDLGHHEIRLFYTSEVVGELASADLAQIIEASKRNNSRVGITGVLLWLESHFFQILEGDSNHVLDLVERIRGDGRNRDMRILHIDRGIDARLFGGWSMKGVSYDMVYEPALEFVLKPTKALLLCLMSAHSIIEHYVDGNISRLISEGINPLTVKPSEKRKIIMFADVRSFTTLSERLPVNVVVSLVNAHFEISSKVIRAHGGEINKFIGDCIMAYFPASNAAGALAAAIDILSLIHKMRKLSHMPFAKLLHVGIGLAEGPVIMGNVGSVLKKDFTPMGDAVNVAARLESSTREVQRNLVFDGNLCRSLRSGAEAYCNFESLGGIHVKGRKAAVDLWSVKDPAVSKYVSKGELEDMISTVTQGKRRSNAFQHVSEGDLQKLERGENLALDLKELEEMEKSWRSLELQKSLRTCEFDIKTFQ